MLHFSLFVFLSARNEPVLSEIHNVQVCKEGQEGQIAHVTERQEEIRLVIFAEYDERKSENVWQKQRLGLIASVCPTLIICAGFFNSYSNNQFMSK
jgi:hypothetical protein